MKNVAKGDNKGMTNREYWYWLCNIEGIGIRKITHLLEYFTCPEEIYRASNEEIKHVSKLSLEDVSKIVNSKSEGKIQENYAKLKERGIYFVTKEDTEYPNKLRNIYDAPYCLYIQGKLPDKNSIAIAIVGARNCTSYGSSMAEYFSRELSKKGIEIISGLAMGIDSYAHQGAIDGGGNTYGVLGCGVDICYPKENFNLYMKMKDRGGIISEYGLGFPPRQYNFPMRNRIISGLADGILVIEAKEKSGSLITVDYGLEQGKNIYAIPGRVSDTLSQGCNNLLKQGAKIVTNVNDIMEDYNINCEKFDKEMKKNDKLLETQEKMVYACLSFIPKHINEIALETSLGIGELAEILLALEFKNYIKRIGTNYYISSL